METNEDSICRAEAGPSIVRYCAWATGVDIAFHPRLRAKASISTGNFALGDFTFFEPGSLLSGQGLPHPLSSFVAHLLGAWDERKTDRQSRADKAIEWTRSAEDIERGSIRSFVSRGLVSRPPSSKAACHRPPEGIVVPFLSADIKGHSSSERVNAGLEVGVDRRANPSGFGAVFERDPGTRSKETRSPLVRSPAPHRSPRLHPLSGRVTIGAKAGLR